MGKKNVVIFYQDTKYVLPILGELLKMYDEHCDFSFYNDAELFEKAVSQEPFIDVLIIDKEHYTERCARLQITNVLLFTDDDKSFSESTSKLNVQLVYKYYSVKEIINEISNCSVFKGIGESEGIVTETIVVYSPIGGSGTTTISLGLAEALTRKHKRVLYFNVGKLQNHAYRFQDRSPLDESTVKRFRETDINFYESIKSRIRTEGFFYIPPFPRCLSSLDLQDRHIVQSITKIKETGVYDFIVRTLPCCRILVNFRLYNGCRQCCYDLRPDDLPRVTTQFFFAMGSESAGIFCCSQNRNAPIDASRMDLGDE